MEILITFILSTAASITGSIAVIKGRKLVSNRYLRTLLNFGKDNLIFVFAHREEGEGSILPRLSTEDFLAMNNITTALNKSGWRHPIRIRDTKHLNNEDRKCNIVTLGGPKVNGFTKEIIDKFKGSEKEIFFLKKEKNNSDRWCICFGDALTYCSKSYDEEAKLCESDNLMETELNDIAFIAKVTNPWNASNKIIIVSGVRGIGTWGAAEYLRKHPSMIYHKKMSSDGHSKNGDFAVAVTVKYNNFDIEKTEFQQLVDLK